MPWEPKLSTLIVLPAPTPPSHYVCPLTFKLVFFWPIGGQCVKYRGAKQTGRYVLLQVQGMGCAKEERCGDSKG